MKRFPLPPRRALAAAAALFGRSPGADDEPGQRKPGLAALPPAPRLLREVSRARVHLLDTLEGKTVRLADFRGKRVLINFWASVRALRGGNARPLLLGQSSALREANRDIIFLGVAT